MRLVNSQAVSALTVCRSKFLRRGFITGERSLANRRKQSRQARLGFIAQELEKVLPEVVDVGGDTYQSVRYGQIVAVAIAGLQQLKVRCEMGQAQSKELADRVQALEAKAARIAT